MRFEWDEAKNLANQRKHGVAFEEATELFDDPFVVSEPDRIENGEQRWQSYGVISGMLLAMVAHTWRDENGDEVIRLISARYATRKERRIYEEQNR
jgi:uncharacterized protein